MNSADKNGIAFDEQALSLVQKTSGDFRQLPALTSPTFVLSASVTAPSPGTIPPHGNPSTKSLQPVFVPHRSTAEKLSHHQMPPFTGSHHSPAVKDRKAAISSLTLPTEAFFTVVSLEGTSSKKKPSSCLYDYDPVTQPKDSGTCLSFYENQQHQQPTSCALFGEAPVKAVSSRPSTLPVTKATIANDRKRSVIDGDSIAMRDNLLYRLQRIVASQRKPLFNYLLPLCLLIGIMLLIYAFRDTAKGVLFWIETQNSWIIFVIFLCMFTIVSFPVTVGYLVLIIASGYLFGFIRGLLTVVIGANLGVAIAHNTIKSLQSKLPVHKLIRNETGRAILRVISGPRAFKIVLFARLTPIPFGLQNTIFGISSVNTRSYHAGTVIGLLPAQTINVYLGSKLRSIHEVLSDHNAALGLAGYGVFVVEVIVGAALMIWVIQKARLELSAALLATTDADSDEKILIEIEA